MTAEGYGLLDSLASSFSLLEGRGIVAPDLAERLRRMVGFRNVAIHDYQALDPRIEEAIVSRHLDGLRAFASRVVQRFDL